MVAGSLKDEEGFFLHLGGNIISRQRTVKDLGIHIDNSLKFSSHINQIVAKAHARASLIHKCFLSKDQSALINAYTTYVRPLLEYSVCVWSPYHLEDIGLITRNLS